MRTSSTSDRWELQASEALDGEIGHEDLIELLDRMVDQPECRDFWRDARRLQSVVDTLEPVSAPELPARSPSPRWRRYGAVVSIAAALVLAFGISLQLKPGATSPEGAVRDVVLEANAGEMSDDRFVDLTVELLQSDRRYQRRMLQILDRIGADRVVDEGGLDTSRGESEYQLSQYLQDDYSSGPEGRTHVY